MNFGTNSYWWIIILILIIGMAGCGCCNNGCGCSNNCGC